MKTYNKIGKWIETVDTQEVRIRKTIKELKKEKQELQILKDTTNRRLDEVQGLIDQAKLLNIEEENE